MYPLAWNVDGGGDSACVGTGNIWECSIFSALFCYKPKIALKCKTYF